jgi:hypothetical protein
MSPNLELKLIWKEREREWEKKRSGQVRSKLGMSASYLLSRLYFTDELEIFLEIFVIKNSH